MSYWLAGGISIISSPRTLKYLPHGFSASFSRCPNSLENCRGKKSICLRNLSTVMCPLLSKTKLSNSQPILISITGKQAHRECYELRDKESWIKEVFCYVQKIVALGSKILDRFCLILCSSDPASAPTRLLPDRERKIVKNDDRSLAGKSILKRN